MEMGGEIFGNLQMGQSFNTEADLR